MDLMSISSWLGKLDRELFTFINSTASSTSLDWIMTVLRNPLTWIPLYAYLLYYIIRYQKKYAWQFILFSIIVVGITDYSSASIFKPLFGRLRPCFDESLKPTIRALVGCGGKYGMPSSHATNHFGLATFWYFTITWMGNRRWWGLWVWAFLICYAQVYVGKHYPGDILAGTILGVSVGFLFSVVFKKWMLSNKK
ncbi:MAG: phosphatase PAP2 family protein [Flavitalea sp.]